MTCQASAGGMATIQTGEVLARQNVDLSCTYYSRYLELPVHLLSVQTGHTPSLHSVPVLALGQTEGTLSGGGWVGGDSRLGRGTTRMGRCMWGVTKQEYTDPRKEMLPGSKTPMRTLQHPRCLQEVQA